MKFIKSRTPSRVFLADAFGALFTFLMLSVVLTHFNTILGLEKSTLYFLAFMALIFMIYSSTIHLVRPRNWPLFMKIIALSNFSYCLITWLVLWHVNAGGAAYLYFAVETIIVSAIAYTEWQYSEKFRFRNFT